MKVVVDGRHLIHPKPSGVGRYTLHLLAALADEHAHRFTVLTSGSAPAREIPLLNASTIHRTHVRFPNKALSAASVLLQQPKLERFAPPSDLLFLPNLSIASISESMPYVITIHDLSWRLFPAFFSQKMRLWHQAARAQTRIVRAQAIITPSESTKRDLVRCFPTAEGKIHVIPHGVDAAFFASDTEASNRVREAYRLPSRYALFVGTIEPRKNLPAILEAMTAYRRRTGDDLALVVVGTFGWKSANVKKRLAGSHRPAWIHHLDYVPQADLPSLYQEAELFLWPSLYEGFGLPVLEAMASGIPVITSHTSSLPELIGTAALAVNPFRPEEITSALLALQDPILRSSLVAAGKERAKRYTWSACARATSRVFESSL